MLAAGCAGKHAAGRYSGTVKVSGSTTVLPLALEAATEFDGVNPRASVQVQGGGSSVGITQLQEGVVQVGNSSRELQGDENNAGLVDHKIAFDIIVIVVNPSIRVNNLTSDEAKGIFTGRIKNWKAVGGRDAPIVVVVRDIASGTREVFDQKVLGSATDKPVASVNSAIQSSSNGVVREIVGTTKNAIGYISFGYVNRLVKPVTLDRVPPDVPNAKVGRYPVARYLHMFTKGPPEGATRGYIDFVLSDGFQNTIVSKEYIRIKQVELSPGGERSSGRLRRSSGRVG
jgi:phosphate transport system substrate-binding protein